MHEPTVLQKTRQLPVQETVQLETLLHVTLLAPPTVGAHVNMLEHV